MTFTDSGNLKKHKMRHAGTLQLPFKCDVCPKAFPQAWNLESHKRTHTGEKPFSCDQCERAFSEAGNLKKHKEKTHNSEKPQNNPTQNFYQQNPVGFIESGRERESDWARSDVTGPMQMFQPVKREEVSSMSRNDVPSMSRNDVSSMSRSDVTGPMQMFQ